MTKTFLDEVMERFDEKVNQLRNSDSDTGKPVDFGFRHIIFDSCGNISTVTDWGCVKSFIRQSISDAVRKMVESVPEKEFCDNAGVEQGLSCCKRRIGWNDAREKLISEAKSLGVEVE